MTDESSDNMLLKLAPKWVYITSYSDLPTHGRICKLADIYVALIFPVSVWKSPNFRCRMGLGPAASARCAVRCAYRPNTGVQR